MPAIVRLGDYCTGHGCFPSRPTVQASPNVFSNGIPVHRQTDALAVHCCKKCHAGNTAQGSPNVFVNNLQVARIGDPVNCGSRLATGSPNVFAND